jgi:hypothetical protein
VGDEDANVRGRETNAELEMAIMAQRRHTNRYRTWPHASQETVTTYPTSRFLSPSPCIVTTASCTCP